ncbi:MAG: rhodanese-like domain-containing protein [Faecousia sp.]
MKGPDINQGVKEYSVTDGAVLLDVRTPDEYRQGHIPGSKNVPLQSIDKVAGMIDNRRPLKTTFCGFGREILFSQKFWKLHCEDKRSVQNPKG